MPSSGRVLQIEFNPDGRRFQFVAEYFILPPLCIEIEVWARIYSVIHELLSLLKLQTLHSGYV
jgi:hypothetical protein